MGADGACIIMLKTKSDPSLPCVGRCLVLESWLLPPRVCLPRKLEPGINPDTLRRDILTAGLKIHLHAYSFMLCWSCFSHGPHVSDFTGMHHFLIQTDSVHILCKSSVCHLAGTSSTSLAGYVTRMFVCSHSPWCTLGTRWLEDPLQCGRSISSGK